MQLIQVTIVTVVILLAAVACGGQMDTMPGQQIPPQSSHVSRPQLTAAECAANGGQVLGDPGDGRVHRPDFRCSNGLAPSANIAAEAGKPIAIEGAVCCPS